MALLSIAASAAQTFVRPLDGARRSLWRLSAKTRFGRACLRDRSLRLAVLAVAHMAVAAALTAIAPLLLLIVGPLVLGVPHFASDVRYLLVRPPLPFGRRGIWLMLAPLLAMTGLRIATAYGAPFYAPLEIALGAAAIGGGIALAPARSGVKALAAALLVVVSAIAIAAGDTTIVVMAHAHNVIGFAFWLWLYRGDAGRRLGWKVFAIAGAYVAVLAFIMGGGLDGVALAAQTRPSGLDLDGLRLSLAPSIEPMLGLRLVLAYAFAQAVHYVVWIRLVPQRLDTRVAPPTFARSIGSLRSDFGRIGFVVVVAACLFLPLAALAGDASTWRTVYLYAVVGHAWLELAVFSALATRART